jgi:hypothetical protein
MASPLAAWPRHTGKVGEGQTATPHTKELFLKKIFAHVEADVEISSGHASLV